MRFVTYLTAIDEMSWPVTTTDQGLWAVGFGLGLILVPRGDRVVHVGRLVDV